MKKSVSIIVFTFFCCMSSFAQLSLDDCQEKARKNYPQVKQFDLIEKSAGYNLSNAGKAWLPQLSVSARTTYQSEATSINIPAMGINVEMPKTQTQAVVEASQIIWDGGVTTSQKKIIKATAAVEKERIEVDLYSLRDRINQIFFSILLLEEQLKQNETLQKELVTNYDRVVAFMKNGVANQSDVDAVRVELLNNTQRKSEITASLKSFREMLSAMTGDEGAKVSPLEKPFNAALAAKGNVEALTLSFSGVSDTSRLADKFVNRPEIRLFDKQLDLYSKQENLIHSGNLPKLGAFLQGGYGNPGLNMLKSGFSPYYIGGVRLSWNLGGFYTQKNSINALMNNRNIVENQRETFVFNNNLVVSRQKNEVIKLSEQINSDDEIISLRQNIKNACSVKVENGTANVTDLLREINAENFARTQKSLHEVQLLLGIYNLKYSMNN
jgi:outer membrane protein TolC